MLASVCRRLVLFGLWKGTWRGVWDSLQEDRSLVAVLGCDLSLFARMDCLDADETSGLVVEIRRYRTMEKREGGRDRGSVA